jgi:hypothetical protein
MLHERKGRLARSSIGLCYDVGWSRSLWIALLHSIIGHAWTIVRRRRFIGYGFVVLRLMRRWRHTLAVIRWRRFVTPLVEGGLPWILHVRRTLVDVCRLSWSARSVRGRSRVYVHILRLCRARWRVERPFCAVVRM